MNLFKYLFYNIFILVSSVANTKSDRQGGLSVRTFVSVPRFRMPRIQVSACSVSAWGLLSVHRWHILVVSSRYESTFRSFSPTSQPMYLLSPPPKPSHYLPPEAHLLMSSHYLFVYQNPPFMP